MDGVTSSNLNCIIETEFVPLLYLNRHCGLLLLSRIPHLSDMTLRLLFIIKYRFDMIIIRCF